MKKHYFFSLLLLLSIITKAQNFPWPIPSNKVLVYWPFNGNVNDTFENFLVHHMMLNMLKIRMENLVKLFISMDQVL